MPAKEELLNGELARLLTRHGVPSEPEQRRGNRRIDIIAVVDGLEIAIECETGFDKRTQAVKDADARFRQDLATLAFAVCYPSGASIPDLETADLTWVVRTREAGRAGSQPGVADWNTGSAADLAEAVRHSQGSIEDADKAAQILSDGLDACVMGLTTGERRRLASQLDLPRDGNNKADGYFTAAKRGMLLLAMAMLFQQRVLEHLPLDPPPDWSGEQHGQWPPRTLLGCAQEPETAILLFDQTWRAILLVDYRPVFESARVALNALGGTRQTGLRVFLLARCVMAIDHKVAGLRHDLLGRIFHRVLDTARYDGSFYTSSAAAALLAALVIREEDRDWSDVEQIANLRICDPACGTGTLLMAAAERIHALRRRTGPASNDDEEALALCLVEDVLYGFDINLTATHMAASALGMLSPETPFGKLNIFRTLLGVRRDVIYNGSKKPSAYVGSLELLDGFAVVIDWPTIARQVDDSDDDKEETQVPPLDLVIMNPPFTRNSLQYDQFPKAVERSLKARQDYLFTKVQMATAAGQDAGAANGFIVLADARLKPDTADLASVLPTAFATSQAAEGTRKFLADRFHIEMVVTSHDPERIFMSENTRIGEMLIVCRRWNSDAPKPPTRFVNLLENPSTPLEAYNLASQIDNPLSNKFTTQSVPADRIARGDWYAVNFVNHHLVNANREMTTATTEGNGRLAAKRLGAVSEIGPSGRRIRDSYRKSDIPTASGRRALWHHKTDTLRTMRASEDMFIEPKSDKADLAEKYWSERSRLLVPGQLRLPLTQVAAVVVDRRTVGSRWSPCRPHDRKPQTAYALAAYLNSSLGLLALLGSRDNKSPSYPAFSLDTLRSVPVPDFMHYGDRARDALSNTFDNLKNEVLLPLPEMDQDPVRRELDDAVTDALDLDPEWVTGIRRALSEEPSITGKRFGT